MYTNLINHIRRYIELNNEEIDILNKYIKPVNLKKKDFLLKEGQICQSIYFVEKGCLRMFFIQTVEKSEILSIDTSSFELMLKELPQMERYFRIIMQRAVAASQLRAKYVYELTKEEFYTHFCNSFPEFVQRVPQYMIASYLGLTPEYVSELRKKKL